ncbi:hypothetical protein [Bacillus sp. FJAT-47783]|uniref:hypothetical protein n=1 Tax=Bacillus sp. FJAT-47783 TaxID=2922712 RepID=UPI001FAC7FF1|nr:hypothetical protein [Bacillus sp. FJAT-47783]
MVAKKTVNQNQNVSPIDVFWDGWFSSIKSFYTAQNDFEARSLDSVKRQKEMLEKTKEQLEKLEQETQGLSKELTESVQQQVQQVLPYQSEQVQQWMNKVEEIGANVQNLALSPYKNMMDMLVQNQNQIECAFTEMINHQKKSRDEFLKTLEGVTEQQKKAQEAFLSSMQSYQTLASNWFQTS